MPKITAHGTGVLIIVVDGYFRLKFRNEDAAAKAVDLLHEELARDTDEARHLRADCNQRNMERFLNEFFGE